MIRVIFSKRFQKQYRKLPRNLQRQTKARIGLWHEQPNNPLLRLHRLEGSMARFYSINITGDIRALYEVIDSEVYVYDMIGTHSQLYG